jgi:hypothetical protein
MNKRSGCRLDHHCSVDSSSVSLSLSRCLVSKIHQSINSLRPLVNLNLSKGARIYCVTWDLRRVHADAWQELWFL